MSMHHQIDPGKRLVIFWFEDHLDPADYKSCLSKVGASSEFKPGFRLLAILNEGIDLSDLSVEAIRQMHAAEATHLKRSMGALGVIIASGEMAEIISRVYAELAALDPNLATNISLVSTAAEAGALLDTSLEDLALPDFAH